MLTRDLFAVAMLLVSFLFSAENLINGVKMKIRFSGHI